MRLTCCYHQRNLDEYMCTLISQIIYMIFKIQSQIITKYIIKNQVIILWSFLCASKALKLYAKSLHEGPKQEFVASSRKFSMENSLEHLMLEVNSQTILKFSFSTTKYLREHQDLKMLWTIKFCHFKSQLALCKASLTTYTSMINQKTIFYQPSPILQLYISLNKA